MEQELEMIIEELKLKALEFYNNENALMELVKKGRDQLKNNEIINNLVDDVQLMTEMLIDWINKEYTDISKDSLIMVIVCLLYITDPLEVIPEQLKFGGLGNLLAITLIMKTIKDEIIKYRKFVQNKTIPLIEETEEVSNFQDENNEEKTEFIEIHVSKY